MDELLEGRYIPSFLRHVCLISNPSLEDYALTQSESGVAKETDELYEATEDVLACAYSYHEDKAFKLGLPFEDFIAEKLALKRRQYNTLLNDPNFEAQRQAQERERQARAYRRAADGG